MAVNWLVHLVLLERVIVVPPEEHSNYLLKDAQQRENSSAGLVTKRFKSWNAEPVLRCTLNRLFGAFSGCLAL